LVVSSNPYHANFQNFLKKALKRGQRDIDPAGLYKPPGHRVWTVFTGSHRFDNIPDPLISSNRLPHRFTVGPVGPIFKTMDECYFNKSFIKSIMS